VLAQGPAGNGRSIATDGGYQLSGQWAFASGCRHATWLNGTAPVFESDGSPRRIAGGGQASQASLFPVGQAEIWDTWHVSGLRGTGSDTFVVEDLFVPEAHTVRWNAESRHEPGPLYRFTTTHAFSTGFASVAMGIARGALDAFFELAQEKTPRGHQSVLRDNPVVQDRVARAEAQLRSARAFLHQTLTELWETATRGEAFTLEQRALIRLATTSGIQQAAQVVDAVYRLAGATAVFEANPFERRFRDVHAVSQQIQGSEAHFQPVGRVFLGADPGPGAL
jgi:alkylation response protein AidB-like acyl-CoA dehydrogenase